MNQETVQEFHERHGGFVLVNNLLIYHDGASKENHPLGRMQEPSENPRERYQLITQYWKIKLSLAVELFDVTKRNFVGQAKSQLREKGNVGGPPSDENEAVRELNELKRNVRFCQSKLEKAKAELEKATAVPSVTDIEQQNRHRVENFVIAVEKIEI